METSDVDVGSKARRPHTKSRKGCRTCKRRHIRCDENMPQCQNCIKHNCFCDYLEQPSPDIVQPQQSMPDLIWTPDVASLLHEWQRTGICSVGGSVHVDLSALGHTYTTNELLLIHHCLKMEQEARANTYTVWTGLTLRFLTTAAKYPFLMHAIFSFAGAALAFESKASDAKSVAYHHSGVAINGLQNAISHFSEQNGDAILAASMLLSWQANEWQNWKSLVTGIRAVINTMRSWNFQSLFPDMITELELAIPQNYEDLAQAPATDVSRHKTTLDRIQFAYARIERLFVERESETRWIRQIREYILRLRDVRPAQTPTEQFEHLQPYRKWLFWVPSNTLRSRGADYHTLILLAHVYATALAIEPLYPSVAPAFSSLLVLRPLHEIIHTFRNFEEPTSLDQYTSNILQAMEFPKLVALEYQIHK